MIRQVLPDAQIRRCLSATCTPQKSFLYSTIKFPTSETIEFSSRFNFAQCLAKPRSKFLQKRILNSKDWRLEGWSYSHPFPPCSSHPWDFSSKWPPWLLLQGHKGTGTIPKILKKGGRAYIYLRGAPQDQIVFFLTLFKKCCCRFCIILEAIWQYRFT